MEGAKVPSRVHRPLPQKGPRLRGDSDLSKISVVSNQTSTDVYIRRTESRSSGITQGGRERADSGSTTVASTILPKLPQDRHSITSSHLKDSAAHRYSEAQSRDLLRRAVQKRLPTISQLQRSDSRMSVTSGVGGGRRRFGSFRTMQAVTQFRRKKRVITLGLEDMMRNYDKEWKAQEILLHQSQPRFSSLLSREAQCLMLRSYEDVFWERLVKLYPEKRETLAQAETPTSLESILDLLPSIPSKDHTFENLSMSKDSLSSIVDSSVSTIVKGQDPRGQVSGKERGPQDRLESLSSFAPLLEEDDASDAPNEVSEKQQWHVSYRLQNAMDAIDKMKIADCEEVTSERYKNKQMDPLTFFNYWVRKWREEFPNS